MKLPKIKWYPEASMVIRGRIAESMFETCYCHESTKNGKPKKSCKNCKGKGGKTWIWLEPLVVTFR